MISLRFNVIRACSNASRHQKRCLILSPLSHKLKCQPIEKTVKSVRIYSTTCHRLCEASNLDVKSGEVAVKSLPSSAFVEALSDEDKRRLEVLHLEMEVFRYSGAAVPIAISDEQWTEIMATESKYKRIKFYRYLCITEHRKTKTEEKKLQKRSKLEEVRKVRNEVMKLDPEKVALEYGLGRNTLFLRFNDGRMSDVYNQFMRQAIMFGQKLVFDFSYSQHMTKRELTNCSEQISDMYGINRQNRSPFNLYLCNFSSDNLMYEQMLKQIPSLYSHSCLANVSEQSYLDLFPREQLVYLTPHCTNDIIEYDHDAVYIVGAIVDKGESKPLSLAKAKKEKIKMARLPLDRFLDWGSGNKSLTLDQMIKILLDIKNTNDWNVAFKHIPKRKLKLDDDRGPNPFNRKTRKTKLFHLNV